VDQGGRAAVTWSRLDLGVGLIVVPGLDLIWDEIGDLVDVVEVEPQTMWRPRQAGGWDIITKAFDWVAGLPVPRLVHGIGFPVGGCEPPDPAGVALTAACASRLGAAHWSEHLSFSQAAVAGRRTEGGFLLPPAQTPAGVEAAVAHIAAYQAAAKLPFGVETGVNYLRPRDGELSDGAFVAAVAGQADCGILLDLHNLLANERNGRQPVRDVLAELPLERVLEVHVAGGVELGGYYLDAHVGGPDDELLALTAAVLPRLPSVRAVMFEVVPESLAVLGAAGMRGVLTELHRICDGSPSAVVADGPRQRPEVRVAPASPEQRRAARDWESALVGYTSRARDDRPADDPGLDLLRELADAARLGELTVARADQLTPLIREHGLVATRRLLHRYLGACPPQRWRADEAAQFDAWLAATLPALGPAQW
jgi:uncharacterized protein (UPF0276 family)